jgi:hypothetical protein
VDGRFPKSLYEGKNVSNVITYGVKVRSHEVPPSFRSQMTANVRFIVRRNPQAILAGGERGANDPPMDLKAGLGSGP